MTFSETDLTHAGREFCQRHNLLSVSALQPDLPVIGLMAHGMESFEDALGRACCDNLLTVEEPTWGMVRAMILRGFAHADAGFVCLAAGAVATAEVVSRVVVESALNVLYILQQDRVGRLYDYLASYVAQERSELAKWKALLGAMPGEEAVVHRKEIDRKEPAVSLQESITQQFARDAGITRTAQPWPKVAERFRAVGEEVDHRVLYAAMCSQTHNDAEDLFNTFALGVLAHHHPGQVSHDFKTRQMAENAYFARFLMYRSVEYLFRCVGRYGESYGVRAISEIGSGCSHRMRELTADLYRIELVERDQFRERLGSSPFNT